MYVLYLFPTYYSWHPAPFRRRQLIKTQISENYSRKIQLTMKDFDTNDESSSIASEYDDYASYDDDSNNEDEAGGEYAETPIRVAVKRVGKGDRDVLTLEVDPGTSVLDLKNLISEELAAKNDIIPVDRQRLVYFGRMLRDNNELLGGESIKMQPESINYVHLSPLPEGAKPSKRSSSSAESVQHVLTESLESRLERARSLGAAARERRRRRRATPYESVMRRRDADRTPSNGEEI